MDDATRKISTTTNGEAPAEGHENSGAPQPLKENGQHGAYWVLNEEERKKGFVRPVRAVYLHGKCGTETRMGEAIAETYARMPTYYGSTFCCACGGHFPVGEAGDFFWSDGSKVGT